MSRPADQQRVLDRIEETLLADDQRLGALFAFFTRLAGDDAMPRAEQVAPPRPRPRRPPPRRLGLAMIAATGLIVVVMFLLTLFAPVRPGCPAAAVAARALGSPAARAAPGCRPRPAARPGSSGQRLARSVTGGPGARLQPAYPGLRPGVTD